MSTLVLKLQAIDAELAAKLSLAPTLEAGLASEPSPLHHSNPFELEAVFLSAALEALRRLRPEETHLINRLALDDAGPRLLDLREARRIGGLLHYVDSKIWKETIQGADPSLADPKWLGTRVDKLKRRFAECGLQKWAMLLVCTAPAQAAPKKPSRLAELETENARLRALLLEHGVNPDEG